MDKITIKAIIGLGNPGTQYAQTRHNIGFKVVELLAQVYDASWSSKQKMEIAEIQIEEHSVLLIKPMTFMNSSGDVIQPLLKRGIKMHEILVVHDEMEKKFGTLTFSVNTSHKGHNGLKSLIAHGGNTFHRLRCGIGRPEHKEDVGNYVLSTFLENKKDVGKMEHDAVLKIVEFIKAGL